MLPMTVRIRHATDADIREFRTRRYDPPYDIYDLGDDRQEHSVGYFLRNDVGCHVIVDEHNTVAGYCTLGTDGGFQEATTPPRPSTADSPSGPT